MLRHTIKEFIVRHLHQARLSPSEIAVAHHISVRYLHHLFRHEGTSVSRFIREQRLERCRADLADPLQAYRGVAEIGARWGLADAAVFSRAFKKTYGISPGVYRAARRAATDGAAEPAPAPGSG
ncbi:helix-turn-helix domain-containing protein [Streptomyces sp. NPDC059788]|uniref:helix-turn-helix domain-containing protein n=1 Tax=Streptomyces sp. NPDC059788 TaxID=3346948 RepID=UPI0036592935